MNRKELGAELLQWHSSMSDPVYAVGSFYIDDQVYPNKDVVEDCLDSIKDDIDKHEHMLKGEKVQVYNEHLRMMVNDLKAFAGYTNVQLRINLRLLKKIAAGIENFLQEDY